jgi:hypothetical protein
MSPARDCHTTAPDVRHHFQSLRAIVTTITALRMVIRISELPLSDWKDGAGDGTRTRLRSSQSVSGHRKSFHLSAGCSGRYRLFQPVLAGCYQDVITDFLLPTGQARPALGAMQAAQVSSRSKHIGLLRVSGLLRSEPWTARNAGLDPTTIRLRAPTVRLDPVCGEDLCG